MRLPGWASSATLAVSLLSASGSSAQGIPTIALDSFPPVSREPITRALTEARAHPIDPARVGRLGMVLHAWEQFDAAADAYARAQTLERRFDWFYLGGLVETRLAHHAQASELLAQAVALSPESVPARLALADAQFESGALDESGQLYRVLAAIPAAEPHARWGLGRVLSAQRDHEAALREFDAAVRLYPEFGAAWYARGLELRRLGKLDEAKEALARAQQYGAQWPAADDPVMTAVRALRDDAAARADRARALERRGDLARAIAEYEAALAADPGYAPAHVNLIALYGRQQEWTKAEAHHKEAVRLGASLAEAHNNWGICLVAQGQLEPAADAFRKAVDVNPHHAAAWNSLGGIALMRGRLDEAEDHLRRAVQEGPSDVRGRFDLARVLIARKRFPEAIEEFRRLAADDHPDRARFLFGLATAEVLSGDVTTGRKHATDALALARARGDADLAAAIERDLAKLPR
jgi:tetratricopeptide (TPR) repeat protein